MPSTDSAPAQAVSAEARRLVDKLRDDAFFGGERDFWTNADAAQCSLLAYIAGLEAKAAHVDAILGLPLGVLSGFRFKAGDPVRKTKGSSWHGRVVGFYSTTLTPIGYAVESSREAGSVQIYPEGALEAWDEQ